MKRTDPTAKFIKAVDAETGTIVGQGVWLVLVKVPAEEALEGDFWDNQEEEEFAQELVRQFMVPRINAAKAANGRLLGDLSNIISME